MKRLGFRKEARRSFQRAPLSFRDPRKREGQTLPSPRTTPQTAQRFLGPASSAESCASRITSLTRGTRPLRSWERHVHAHLRVWPAGQELDNVRGTAPRPVAGRHQPFDDLGLTDARAEHRADVGFGQVRAHFGGPLELGLRRWPCLPLHVERESALEAPRSSELEAVVPSRIALGTNTVVDTIGVRARPRSHSAKGLTSTSSSAGSSPSASPSSRPPATTTSRATASRSGNRTGALHSRFRRHDPLASNGNRGAAQARHRPLA